MYVSILKRTFAPLFFHIDAHFNSLSRPDTIDLSHMYRGNSLYGKIEQVF
jgi:hypothetical protein